ncbi:MAG TPA: NAD(P)/FAD-dependent oxidoreductase [Flammeovirgaceae bacterium]|nr:NAD(P)/FAD-dependent oxidoreductase [Flammeovirgaceae bacterium]
MNNNSHEVIIIGSGFGGIATAIRLQEAGIHDYIILERAPEPGGTWWQNTYPGAAVDVQSPLYCLKHEPYDWSRMFALQPEILAYTNHLLDKHRLRSKIACHQEVTAATYDDQNRCWQVTTASDRLFTAPVLINASGILSQPAIPDIPGREQFQGESFHTSQWNHDFDYKGKRVAVIGTGASAVQVVPAIAPQVAQLYVLQRTPHWLLPRPDRIIPKWERQLYKKVPLVQRLVREWLYWKLEARMIAFKGNQTALRFFRNKALRYIKKQVKDPALRQKLTPDFMLGCKRVLLSNDYYPALQRENVRLVTGGIERITPTGIQTKQGEQLDVDLIVWATGFHAAEDNIPYPVRGRQGLLLQDYWHDGAHAYIGTAIPHFPNFFILAGPNTGIGHTSALHIIESQLNYVMDTLLKMRQHGWQSVEVKEDIEKTYNKWVQEKMQKTVWQTGGCHSWYQTADGKNTTLYPTYSFLFRKATARMKEADHLME